MNDTDDGLECDALPRALALFEEAAKEPRLTSGQIHALLFIASETQIEAKLDRLPTISDIARATGLTHSGGSRLMGSLLKDGSLSTPCSDDRRPTPPNDRLLQELLLVDY